MFELQKPSNHALAIASCCAIAAAILLMSFAKSVDPRSPSPGGGQGFDHVILISVDGLRPEALLPPLVDRHPALRRLTRGAWTPQARCDPDISITLPNHVDILTGRLVAGEQGHGWVENRDPPSRSMGGTLHLKAGRYISSVFDVAHDAGLHTALLAGKWKFALFEQSYGQDAGGSDDVEPDFGRDKIDCFMCSTTPMEQVRQLNTMIQSASERSKKSFSFLHLVTPDFAGHSSGWSLSDGSPYRQSLIEVDLALAELVSKIDANATLKGKVAIVLTSDHGGGVPLISHVDPEAPVNFTIPFVVWRGADQTPVDLYSINASSRHCPGVNEPFAPGMPPPIRNADAGNTCLQLLGLPAIPGSTVNARQELLTAKPSAPVQ